MQVSSLDDAILVLAAKHWPGGFDVSEDAPQNLDELWTRFTATGRMVVWNGGSEKTIYRDANVNYAFRAWHDWHHLVGSLPFDAQGEQVACQRQCEELRQEFGDNEQTQQWCKMLDAEIIGQLLYEQRHSSFPDNQAAFVLAYMSSPERALRTVF